MTIKDLIHTYAYTPGGGVADPNHPIYAILWLVRQALNLINTIAPVLKLWF